VISQTVEYALRAILTIAQNDGQPCTSKKIAEITQVPNAYLSKLMQGLVRGGIVNSQRGLHGGFVLTRPPEELTIWDIVDQVEPIKRIRECPLSIKSHGGSLCPLHRRLDRALETIETMFQETTVAQLLSEPGSSTPLCEDSPNVVSLGLGG
jgi:Rrf2 family transcriptional regulator, nitric oxide-sensitive transcriptional repressor